LLNGILDSLGVVNIANLHRQITAHQLAVKVAQLAIDIDLAERIALPFLNHVSDDEVFLIRRQFRNRRNHAEIGIAFGQVELPQLLLVKRQTIRIVAGV